MKNILDKLRGGDLRSIDRANEVVGDIEMVSLNLNLRATHKVQAVQNLIIMKSYFSNSPAFIISIP